MPVGKKKSTTTEVNSSIPNPTEFSPTPLPLAQEFHHQLQQEACTVMRAFLQKVMREELDAFFRWL
jgi:hypothetical protein